MMTLQNCKNLFFDIWPPPPHEKVTISNKPAILFHDVTIKQQNKSMLAY